MKSNELWNQIRKGESKAYNELYELYADNMFSYGIKISGDKILVNEAIQDVFINLYNQRKNICTPDSIKVYLLMALRNNIFMLYNRYAKASGMWSEDDFAEIGANYNFKLETDPESIMVKTESDHVTSKTIQDALNELPERQKEAIYLKYYNNLTGEEIAEVMHINHQTVRSTLMYGLKKLREKLSFSDTFELLFMPISNYSKKETI